MQTVYRQSFKKFYMQTGASESAFVWQLCQKNGRNSLSLSHRKKAKNILLKTSRHYGNNDYAIIHARFDRHFPRRGKIMSSQTQTLKDTRKKIYINVFCNICLYVMYSEEHRVFNVFTEDFRAWLSALHRNCGETLTMMMTTTIVRSIYRGRRLCETREKNFNININKRTSDHC